MPKYSYRCSNCEHVMDVYHSFKEQYNTCDKCGSIDCLEKLPSKFSVLKNNTEMKIGDLVKKSIKDFSEELSLEKEKLKNEFYKPDK